MPVVLMAYFATCTVCGWDNPVRITPTPVHRAGNLHWKDSHPTLVDDPIRYMTLPGVG